MSRELLPYMTDEQFSSVAFVFRHKTDGIRVVGLLQAKVYEDTNQGEHLATFDSFKWVEYLLRSSQKERNKTIKEILK